MARSADTKSTKRRLWAGRVAGLLFALVTAATLGPALASGCNWDPRRPFERNAPEVEEAIAMIESGQYESAQEVLGKYLGTGVCGTEGGIAVSDTAREKYNGTFDLGLVLFHIAEKFGARFGEEDTPPPGAPPGNPFGGPPAEDPQAKRRSQEVDCALIITKAIAADPKVPIELRARAQYLAGNLEFLRKRFEEAVKEYDLSLALIPGVPDDAGGDGIGRDAAWNRAIALRRIQDQKDAGNDADADSDAPDSDDADADSPDTPDSEDADSGNDGGGDSGDGGDDADADGGKNPDSGADGGTDAGDGGAEDAGKDGGGDAGKDDKKDQPEPEPDPANKQPVAPDSLQDDRILDRLEEAPSYQEEEAKKRAAGRRRPKMEDK